MTALPHRPAITSYLADHVGDRLLMHEWQQFSLDVNVCHEMIVHVSILISALMYVMHWLLGCSLNEPDICSHPSVKYELQQCARWAYFAQTFAVLICQHEPDLLMCMLQIC